MTELLSADDLIFEKNNEKGIYSGGFRVNNIFIKQGISPIITLGGSSNIEEKKKGNLKNNNVGDLWSDLVVPNWAFQLGDITKHSFYKNNKNIDENDFIDNTLYDKLIGLVSISNNKEIQKIKQHTKKIKNKKNKQHTRKNY